MSRASLPMYDWPEQRHTTDALWARIREGLAGLLPATLCRPVDHAALNRHWRDPALRLSQCCWGPLSLGLEAHLRVLAQPDYSDVPGGQGPFYRSALIAREGQAVAPPGGHAAALPADILSRRVLAVNGRDSMSGWLALAADLGGDPAHLAAGVVETGGHRASVRAVAEGRADLAAIDCRSWAMALAHEPAAEGLVVIGWTAARPGLPYVTARTTDAALVRKLQDRLTAMGCHPPH
ncbi:MAG: phosphate/phosphite/phosphonate ABC transporter substrate-binding protein [Pararhodobacter sp.]